MWQVTGSQVRKDPLKKVYICQVLGRDIRLKGSCAGYSPDAYAPGRYLRRYSTNQGLGSLLEHSLKLTLILSFAVAIAAFSGGCTTSVVATNVLMRTTANFQ